MIAPDTNVILRYLVRDEPEQAAMADSLMNSLTPEEPAFISREVVIEIAWVLRRSYRLSRDEVASVVEELASNESLVIETSDDVLEAASTYRQVAADFSDLMILAAARRVGALPVITFDRRFSRQRGVQLLSAEAEG